MKSIEAVFWSALAFTVALITEIIASSFVHGQTTSDRDIPGLGTILLLVLIEELAKFFTLRQAAAGKILAPIPVIIFGTFFGLIEAWLLGQKNELGTVTGMAATLPIILVHLATAAIYGYCLNRKKWFWTIAGLCIGVLFHATYNLQEIFQVSAPSIRWMQVSALTLAAIALLFAQIYSLHDKDA